MGETLRPETDTQVREAIAWAAAEETALEVIGAGTKRGLGRPVEAERVLDLSGLSGITSYRPEELVLTARSGTPVAEIDAALSEKNQMLAFEPPDFGPLYGGAAGRGTLGGAIACNLSGPRRFAAGAARDHVLGFSAVSGRGEAFKAGGRVVKNVTGYDLSKLMAGSFGTLAVLTEVTVRVVPAPEKMRTVLVAGLDAGDGIALLRSVAGSALGASGLAFVEGAVAARSAVDYVAAAGASVAAIRIDGAAESVVDRTARLQNFCADACPGAALEELHRHNSTRFWRELGDGSAYSGEPLAGRDLWRLSVPPAAAVSVAGRLGAEFFDWGGGLVWAAPDGTGATDPTVPRAAADDAGGYATLMRAPDDVRRRIPVFHPEPEPVAALSRRIKESFDPRGILNPGRMTAGA